MNNREDKNDSSFPSCFKDCYPGNGEDVVNESTEFVAKARSVVLLLGLMSMETWQPLHGTSKRLVLVLVAGQSHYNICQHLMV